MNKVIISTMKTRIYLTVVLSTICLITFAQADSLIANKVRKASYGIGYSRTSLLDKFVSNQTYKSDNVPFHFRYSIEKGITLFEYDFNGVIGFNYKAKDSGIVTPPSAENSPEVVDPELSSPVLFQQQAYVRYLARVYQTREEKFSVYVGGAVSEQFFMSFAEEPTFTFAELNLDLALMLSYKFDDKHSIRACLSGTILGTRVNLPKANVHNVKDGGPDGVFSSASWASQPFWHNDRGILSIEYVRQLSSEWSVGCEFSSGGYHITEEPEVRYNDRSLVVKLTRTL